jgi:alcohol dehydrogenase (NADP+)
MFAKAMGAEVTALSSSDAKRDDALNLLGAHHYLNYNDEAAFKSHTDLFDIIVCTAFGSTMDWKKMLTKMDVGGKFVVVGVPQAPISFPSSSIVHRQVSVVGSLIGSPSLIEEMLKFAEKHKIKSVIEKMPMSKANEAVNKMRNEGSRFRIVLENAKI